MKKIALNLLLLLLAWGWGGGGGVMFDTKYSRHSEDNGDCSSGVFVLLGFGGVDLLGVVDDVFWWRCRSSRSRRCRSPSAVSSGGGVGLLGVGGDVCFHPGRDGWDGRRDERFFEVLSS